MSTTQSARAFELFHNKIDAPIFPYALANFSSSSSQLTDKEKLCIHYDRNDTIIIMIYVPLRSTSY